MANSREKFTVMDGILTFLLAFGTAGSVIGGDWQSVFYGFAFSFMYLNARAWESRYLQMARAYKSRSKW